MTSFIAIAVTLIFIAGYGIASSNVIKLKADKWVCTVSVIIEGVAVCSEYKLKETK